MLTKEAYYVLKPFYEKRGNEIMDEVIKRKLSNNSKYSTVLRQLPHWLDVLSKNEDYLKKIKVEKVNGRYAGFYQITPKGIAEYNAYVKDRRRIWVNSHPIFKMSNIISFATLIAMLIGLKIQSSDLGDAEGSILLLEQRLKKAERRLEEHTDSMVFLHKSLLERTDSANNPK